MSERPALTLATSAAATPSPAPRYWAFISYSHRDESVARLLQKRLETYRLPPRLVGRETPLGPVPRQAKPVFRDRDELHAGADLGAHVRAGLAASRWLIVVCSPDAARSPWVEREIVEFKRLHGESRVLALIAAGEPYASRLPGREAEECFPNALRHALDAQGEPRGAPLEPIAADLRVQGDGPRRAPLKLLAGMVGVGFDELVRRDHARRMRWLAGIAGASALGMAVLTVLTVLAVQGRNEAQRQRAQAEGLIEFMLVDLRKKLEPVGRLEVLDAVGEKVLAHYESQQDTALEANALGHRSRAQHLIGEIREQRGQLAEALVAYERAAATTEKLLAQAPQDAQRIFDHAQSVYWVGHAAFRRGQVAQAERSFTQYRELAQRLVALDPTKPEWQLEVAYAAHNLGVLLLQNSRPAESLAMLGEVRDARTRLLGARPELAYDLAHTYGWMAQAYYQLAQYERAIEMQQVKQVLFLGLPDAEKNKRVQRGLQTVSGHLALYELSRGDLPSAERHVREAALRAERLSTADPSNLFWFGELCNARLRLADVQLLLGESAVARESVRRVLTDRTQLLASDANRVDWQVGLNGAALSLAARTSALPRDALRDELGAYLATVQRLTGSGTTLDRDQSSRAADAQYELGRLLAADGQAQAAREHWRAAAERLQPDAAGIDYDRLLLLARIRWALGEQDAAHALLARIQTSPYRHPALAGFMSEVAQRTGAAPTPSNNRRNP